MIILGVDPGTLITGYGVIEADRGEMRFLACGDIRNTGTTSMPLRLKAIYERLQEIIRRYAPDEFAIETAFYGKNAQSALKLGHARGVSILAAVNAQVPTSEYSPREVKKAIVGNGTASKAQIQYMVQSLLHLKETPKYFDTTDALAVAICHLHRVQRPAGNHKSWMAFVTTHPELLVRSRTGRRS
jgi:crossover junction endodeoxyribonuclease RuvC